MAPSRKDPTPLPVLHSQIYPGLNPGHSPPCFKVLASQESWTKKGSSVLLTPGV